MSYPDVLDLGLHLAGSSTPVANYFLPGVVCHNGFIFSGHYTFFGKAEGQWFYFNNGQVLPTSPLKALSQKQAAYMLIYNEEV